jgi:hypothetical protein
MTEFIFYLTYNDTTIWNALDVFMEIQDTGVRNIGFKDVGLSLERLIELREAISKAGKKAFLEVVTVNRETNILSAKMAVKLQVDCLMGSLPECTEQVKEILKNTGIKFFPYVGRIVGHPCQLRGTIKEIVEQGKRGEDMGVDGVDLLAYRYDGDIEGLMSSVIDSLNIPVIIAGSINSLERIRKVSELGAWGFTIGTAVLEKRLVPNGTLSDQIKTVLREGLKQ